MPEPRSLSEEELARLERRKDPETITHLVSTIRQQQHDLDRLHLSLDVARRDREELRAALLAAQAEIRRLRGEGETDADGPNPSDQGEP